MFITDEKRTSLGSGVLFYPGTGEKIYIFTCAHVLDELADPFQIYYLLPVNREEERYQVEKLEASREQVKYSPIEEINKSEEEIIKHSVDAAVICLKKRKKLI